ncbi:MAG: NAD(P)/FAD-dependent oxidoreductase [Chloroflexi bacterium]|nr:NAD(P)/FAD-dependent oxidoreductase [Chloroflexota bacterium]
MRVAIVGAGPAGLFAAYELADKGVEVIIVDMGKPVAERRRDDGFDLLHGVGGSGTFSDGKINFHTQVGGDLYTFMNAADAWDLMDHIEAILKQYGVEVIPTEDQATHDLEKRAAKAGVLFLPIRQAHVGSDHLVELIQRFSDDLRERGVRFRLNTRVEDVVVEGGRVAGLLLQGGDRLEADAAILAPGRVGSQWMGEVAQRHGLTIAYNPIDVGVRVEVPAIVMEDVIEISYDPKFYVRAPTYDDRVRTFCVSPHGFVVKEVYAEEGAVGVNGHALKGKQSPNTNFALLTSINLTEPIESTTAYGVSIAQMATTIGGGRPILQSLGDLRRHRRSTWGRLQKSPSDVVPTLRDVTPGDITMALPGRVVTDLLEALEMLARVIPGLDSDRTLLYALELKRYAIRPKTDRHLQTEIPGLYVAGDGAGVSRGIAGAAATGEIAARGILEKKGEE